MATKKIRVRHIIVKGYKVKGITMTKREYEAFVRYLNNFRVQSYTKQDVSHFLEALHFKTISI